MSLDLFERENEDVTARRPGTSMAQVDVPFFHNLLPGGMKVMAGELAKAGRAVSMLAAPVAVLADEALSGYGYGTEIQDRFFQQHDEFFGSAVKYWTPEPGEVGMAGEVVGSLAGMLPLIIGSAPAAVGAQVLSQGEDLIDKGVPADKAVGVGVAQAAGLATGIWMPILGQNLWQRVVLGGAGFNVLQGAVTRGASQAILGEDKAAELFPVAGAKEITLDLLLGLAFGGVAHLSPRMRAEGKDVWAKISEWARDLPPEQVDAIAALRQAEHLNVETMPGKPMGPEDIEANVNRTKAALEQLLREEPVNVEQMPAPKVEPDRARQVDAETRTAELAVEAERVRTEEGIPEALAAEPEAARGMPDEWVEVAKLPPEEQPGAIGAAIERRLAELGVDQREATANGALWRAFFDTASRKYGVQAAELMRDYGIDIQRMRAQVPAADAALATGGAEGYGGGRGRLEQSPGNRPRAEDLQRTVAGGSPEPGWIGATRIRRGTSPEPLAVYRGSELELAPEHFELGALGHASGNPSSGLGVWFTTTRSEAGTYGKVQEAYLDLRNPKLVKIEDLPGFDSAEAAHAWREELRAQGYDGLVVTAQHLGGKTHVVAFDAKQVVPIGGHGEYAQGVKPGPMFYSELARQIQTLPESRVPAEGLTAKEWKALLIEPESRRTVAIRDEKNRPTGQTREVVSPEKVRLPGVTQDEIKWSGLQEWLELHGAEAARATQWADAKFQSKTEGGDIGTIVDGNGKMLMGIIRRADAERTIREQQALSEGKITRQQVSDFLEQNGVRVDEVMLGSLHARTPADAPISADVQRLRELGFQPENNPEDASAWAFTDITGAESLLAPEEMTAYAKGMADQIAVAREGFDSFTPEERAVYEQMEREAAALREAAPIAERVLRYLEGATEGTSQPTKYQTYQEPGAKEGSYRELLLTLPGKSVAFDQAKYDSLQQQRLAIMDRVDAARTALDLTGDAKYQEELRELSRQRNAIADEMTSMEIDRDNAKKQGTFQSNHFNEENILAHVRFNERTDADGKRVLFVEEIQSDWAQKGKKEGFSTEPDETRVYEEKPGRWRVGGVYDPSVNFKTRDEALRYLHRIHPKGIPNAPFVGKTEAWVGLVLKRMIRYAAENGFDSVAWTRGEQQVGRYTGALRKAVDTIEWTKTADGIHIQGYKGKNGDAQMPGFGDVVQELGVRIEGPLSMSAPAEYAIRWRDGSRSYYDTQEIAVEQVKTEWKKVHGYDVKPQKVVDTTEKETALSDAIGKSMAERIIKDPAQSGTIEGENIRVDDTGMASFYDRIVPNVANQLLKKLGGGKVREVGIEIPSTGDKVPELREITDAEHDAMQGLENFSNGTKPLVAQTRLLVDGRAEQAIVAVDRAGVHILLNDGEIEALVPAVDMMQSAFNATPKRAKELAAIWAKGGANSKEFLREHFWNPDSAGSMWPLVQVIRGEASEIRPAQAETPKQQGFDLTPQMRERALGGQSLFQAKRGQITFRGGETVIGLFEGANASTFVHESGHLFLQITRDLALRADAPAAAVEDWARLESWLGVKDGELTTDAHEQFARGWEKYLGEGEAPTPELRGIFQQFRDWLLQVYRTLTELDVNLSDEIRGVMGRMLASEAADPTPASARATTEAEGAPAPTGRAEPPPPRGGDGEARATPEAQDEPDPWTLVGRENAPQQPAAPARGLEDQEVRDILLVMAEHEAGWAEIGGRHLGGEMGQPNFSAWVPRADWWPQREGKLNEAQTREAVRKALAGEKLKKKEQLAIDYMVKIAGERASDVGLVGREEWELTAREVADEGLEPSTRNVVDAALIARATEISEGAVDSLAIRYEDDDAGFMQAVRRLIDENHRETRRIRADLEAARSRQEAGGQAPGPAGAEPPADAGAAGGQPAARAAAGERPAGEPQGPAGAEPARVDPVRQAAEDFVSANPERPIIVGKNADGTPIVRTAQEYLEEARMQAELARQDVGLFEVAARCLLGGGS